MCVNDVNLWLKLRMGRLYSLSTINTVTLFQLVFDLLIWGKIEKISFKDYLDYLWNLLKLFETKKKVSLHIFAICKIKAVEGWNFHWNYYCGGVELKVMWFFIPWERLLFHRYPENRDNLFLFEKFYLLS